jgi:hypothetical protein
MTPLVPTRGTGKPLVLVIAMAGVSRVALLVGGKRPLMPLEAAELVCSFLHVRPARPFNTFPLLSEGLRGCSLHFLLDELYRAIYIEPSFNRYGEVTAGHLSVEYAIAVIQRLGVGTDYGCTLLQSTFLAPGVVSTWPFEYDHVDGHVLPQSVLDSPGFAWTALVSPPRRLAHLLREAVILLSGHMFAWPREGVDYIELRADFDHMMSILGLEHFGDDGVLEFEHAPYDSIRPFDWDWEDGDMGDDPDYDAAYLDDQLARQWERYM